MDRYVRGVAAAIALTLLSGCGAGGATSPIPTATTSRRPVTSRTITLQLKIPAPNRSGSSRWRRPRFVSPSTQGLGVSYRATATAGNPAAAFPDPTTPLVALDLSAQSPACSTQSDGSRLCTLGLALAPGTVDFEISAWDGVATGGSFATNRRLSTTTILGRTIGAASATTLTFTLDGIVNAVTPSRLTASDSGTPQSAMLSVNAEDADGNVIVGSGAFVDASGSPVTITLGATATGPGSAIRTALATTTATPESSMVAVTYLGGASSGTKFSVTTSSALPGGARGTTLAIDPRAVVTEYPLSSGVYPTGITAGPNGLLWFAESSAAVISSVSTLGTFGVTIPFSGSQSDNFRGITAGPDGNLWVAVQGPLAIDRVTPGGVATAFTTD